MFASLKCDELDAFIMACQDRDKPKFTAESKIPKKGTLSEAALDERNKIRIAFDSRESKNGFIDKMPNNISISNEEDRSGINQLGI